MNDPWHYPRPQLAKQYLDFFDTGVSNAMILFQQRRFGKTEFCQQDLAPAAEARGYVVVYASFWQARLAPTAVLLHALEKGLEKRTFRERVKELLTAPVTKLKLSGELMGSKAEAELDLAKLPQRPTGDLLLYLSDLTQRVAKRAKGKLLFILDEVQELAESTTNDALVAALRTILDTQRKHIKVVFTGSSQEGLRQMFSSAKAPFFHFGTRMDLPALDAAFVQHIANAFHSVSRARVSVEDLRAAFDTLHGNPYYFRKLVELVLAQPKQKIGQALVSLRERLAEEQGFPALWQSLQPIDRAVILWLGRGPASLFNQTARAYIAQQIQEEEVSIHEVQASLRRLMKQRVVRPSIGRGQYALDDAELGSWCLQLAN